MCVCFCVRSCVVVCVYVCVCESDSNSESESVSVSVFVYVSVSVGWGVAPVMLDQGMGATDPSQSHLRAEGWPSRSSGRCSANANMPQAVSRPCS